MPPGQSSGTRNRGFDAFGASFGGREKPPTSASALGLGLPEATWHLFVAVWGSKKWSMCKFYLFVIQNGVLVAPWKARFVDISGIFQRRLEPPGGPRGRQIEVLARFERPLEGAKSPPRRHLPCGWGSQGPPGTSSWLFGSQKSGYWASFYFFGVHNGVLVAP